MSGRDGGRRRGRGLDDLLYSISSDGRSLYDDLASQQVDRIFLARATALGGEAAEAASALLVDFSTQVRRAAAAGTAGARAGFPADDGAASSMLDKMAAAARSALAGLLSSAARGRRGSVPRELGLAEALETMFLDGYLLANHPSTELRLSADERARARGLSTVIFGADGRPVSDAWAREGVWEAPAAGAGGPAGGASEALRADIAEARAEALEREVASLRAELDRRAGAERARRDLLEVIRGSGNISFETASDAVAFAAEALPDRLAFSRKALADASAMTGGADATWDALRALAFEFQPAAAVGRPPGTAEFLDSSGYELEALTGGQPAYATASIGRTSVEAVWRLSRAGGPGVSFTILSDGRVGVVRIGGAPPGGGRPLGRGYWTRGQEARAAGERTDA